MSQSLWCARVARIERPYSRDMATVPVGASGPREERADAPALPGETLALLGALPMASMVLDSEGGVVLSSPRAEAMGLVRRQFVTVGEIADLVDEAGSLAGPRQRQIRVKRPPLGRGMLDLRVLVVPLAHELFAVLIEDLSEERRVDAVRRDFVANVSHELKTPVGAMSLLAEAIIAAADDEQEVRRFAERMLQESARLANLINDIIDLSRLQGDNPMAQAEVLDVDSLIGQAVEEVRTVAAARDINVMVSGVPGAFVLGNRSQLLTALRNLLANAIAYSEPHTQVAIAAEVDEQLVEIDVKDQGMGIPAYDLDRIFERFYRVDPARSRGTGGTGLGLAIVKHVCENHGGEVSVWSEVGVGSTFTIRLPLATNSQAWITQHNPGGIA